MQIRDMEQSSLDTQFQKSNDIYGLQTGFNAAAAKGAKDDELRWMYVGEDAIDKKYKSRK